MKTLLTLGVMLFLATAAGAQTCKVSAGWDYPLVPPDLAGFRVYLDGGVVVETGPDARTATFDCVDGGETWVRAFDTAGNESQDSAHQIIEVPLPAPENFMIEINLTMTLIPRN